MKTLLKIIGGIIVFYVFTTLTFEILNTLSENAVLFGIAGLIALIYFIYRSNNKTI